MIFDNHIQDIKDLICSMYPTCHRDDIQIQDTRKEFTGDFTVVVFALAKFSKKSVENTAIELGSKLVEEINYISSFNFVKGFLNLKFLDSFWYLVLENSYKDNFHVNACKNKKIALESCSPNTNKPLHLGHLRNILLGDAISNILVADGFFVEKVQIINDRGIHICKSMLAWLKFGNSETPNSSKVKGDHLVGKYYVIFEQEYQKEQNNLIQQGHSKEEAKIISPLLNEAKEMLKQWESGKADIISLWKKMNSWVYQGFEKTYNNIGVSFDKIYYESETYLIGKKHVLNGLKSGIFSEKDDGSIWARFQDNNIDDKLLLRSDGTAVYMTQDIGTAILRYDDLSFDNMVYVVGNEQNHHFNLLFRLLKKMGFSWYNNLFHLSYGMVNLPDGKMKSREGNVIDIDDLLKEMYSKSKDILLNSGKLDLNYDHQLPLIIGDAALKYFILKPDPKKEILFNPEASIDFNGHTGPFIQYTYARINSILSKGDMCPIVFSLVHRNLLKEEISLIKLILNYPTTIHQSAKNFNPSILANYLYSLAKEYNHFYQKIPILSAEDKNDVNFRVSVSRKVAELISKGMKLLGIKVPAKM
jgi:arginyl-tRNA synthetase|tara:strand:+ start:1943 stop:3703 length:1761 start_codon:yes stop_codon:yes gene_type:complete